MEHPLHVNAVTGCVTNDVGEILLVRVAGRGWEMPGGQVEQGEDLIAGLRREIEEESGCQVAVRALIGIYSKLSPAPPMVLHLFRCSHVGGRARAREAQVPEVGWFHAEDARRLVTHPPSARRLDDALTPPGGVVYLAYRATPFEAVTESLLPVGHDGAITSASLPGAR